MHTCQCCHHQQHQQQQQQVSVNKETPESIQISILLPTCDTTLYTESHMHPLRQPPLGACHHNKCLQGYNLRQLFGHSL